MSAPTTIEQFLAEFKADMARQVAENLAEILPSPDRLYNVKQAADRLNMSERTVWKHKASGELGFVMVGTGQSGVRFEASELERFVASRRVAAR